MVFSVLQLNFAMCRTLIALFVGGHAPESVCFSSFSSPKLTCISSAVLWWSALTRTITEQRKFSLLFAFQFVSLIFLVTALSFRCHALRAKSRAFWSCPVASERRALAFKQANKTADFFCRHCIQNQVDIEHYSHVMFESLAPKHRVQISNSWYWCRNEKDC